MKNPLIKIESLSRKFRSILKEPGLRGSFKNIFAPRYKETDAVKDVNLSIDGGTFTGLIGSNGAGKTTLIKMIAGLLPPTAGTVRVFGENPFERTIKFRTSIALVLGQKAQLWWDLTANDSLELLRAIYEIDQKTFLKRKSHLVEALQVEKVMNTQIRRLSLGERMKVELVGALIHHPALVLLDEPTIGLDVVAAHNLRNFLLEHQRASGATILLTSHNMGDIERLCPRILMMREGQVIFDGSPHSLKTTQSKRLLVQLNSEVSSLQLSALLKFEVEELHEPPYLGWFSIEASEEQIYQSVQMLLNRKWINHFRIEEPSLEKVVQTIFHRGMRL